MWCPSSAPGTKDLRPAVPPGAAFAEEWKFAALRTCYAEFIAYDDLAQRSGRNVHDRTSRGRGRARVAAMFSKGGGLCYAAAFGRLTPMGARLRRKPRITSRPAVGAECWLTVECCARRRTRALLHNSL